MYLPQVFQGEWSIIHVQTTPKSVSDNEKIQNHRVTSSPFVFLSAKMVQRHTSRGRSFEKALAMFSSINTPFDSRLRTHKHDRKIINASSFHSYQWLRKDPSCRRLAKRETSVRDATRHRT